MCHSQLHPEAAHFRDKGLPFYGEIKTMLNKIAVERTPQPGPNTLRTAGQTTGGDVTDEGDGSEEHDPPNVSGDDADALKNYSEDRSGSDNDRRSHTRQVCGIVLIGRKRANDTLLLAANAPSLNGTPPA